MAEHHGRMESQGWAKFETQGRSPPPPELDQVEKTHFRPNLKGPSVLAHMYTGNWLGDLPSYLQIDCGFQPIPKDAWQLDMNHTKKGRNIKQALESLEHQPGNEISDLPLLDVAG